MNEKGHLTIAFLIWEAEPLPAQQGRRSPARHKIGEIRPSPVKTPMWFTETRGHVQGSACDACHRAARGVWGCGGKIKTTKAEPLASLDACRRAITGKIHAVRTHPRATNNGSTQRSRPCHLCYALCRPHDSLWWVALSGPKRDRMKVDGQETEVLTTADGTTYLAHEIVVQRPPDISPADFVEAISEVGGTVKNANSLLAEELGYLPSNSRGMWMRTKRRTAATGS